MYQTINAGCNLDTVFAFMVNIFTIDMSQLWKKSQWRLGDVFSQAKTPFIRWIRDKTEGEKATLNTSITTLIREWAKLENFIIYVDQRRFERTLRDGHKWIYSEGGMSPYDSLNMPSAHDVWPSERFVTFNALFERRWQLPFKITQMEAELLPRFPTKLGRNTKWLQASRSFSDACVCFLWKCFLVTV